MLRILFVIIVLLSALTLAAPVFSKDKKTESDGKSNMDTLYHVKAEISDVKNRTLEARVRNHKLIIDQPKEFGADDQGMTPPELLAVSMGSCVISTIQLIAVQDNLDIKDIAVTVEGTVDFAKALGISDANRAGFSGFTVTVDFKSSMTSGEKEKLLAKVAQVGAAIDNIQNTTPVKYELAKP